MILSDILSPLPQNKTIMLICFSKKYLIASPSNRYLIPPFDQKTEKWKTPWLDRQVANEVSPG